MTRNHFTRPAPEVERNREARARQLKRLALIAEGLRSAAAASPADAVLQSRLSAAGTACQQLVAHLRRQDIAKLDQLVVERTEALADMRRSAGDLDAFAKAAKREAELAVRIRQLRAEVSHG